MHAYSIGPAPITPIDRGPLFVCSPFLMLTFSKNTFDGNFAGLSPLAAGQWQLFLTCYAGLFAVNNVLR